MVSIEPNPDHLIVFFRPLFINKTINKVIKNITLPKIISVISSDEIISSRQGLRIGSRSLTDKNAIIHFEKEIKLEIKPFLIPESKLNKINNINITSKRDKVPSKISRKESINVYKTYSANQVEALRLKIMKSHLYINLFLFDFI